MTDYADALPYSEVRPKKDGMRASIALTPFGTLMTATSMHPDFNTMLVANLEGLGSRNDTIRALKESSAEEHIKRQQRRLIVLLADSL